MKVGFLTSLQIPGLANYSIELCKALLKHHRVKVLIAADINKKIEGERLLVIKSWSQLSPPLTPLKVLRTFLIHKVDIIHCQYEYWTYGRGIYSFTIFPTLLLFLKTLRRTIVVTMHGAIPRSKLVGLLFKKGKIFRYFSLLGEACFICLVRTIAFLSSKIIVHSKLARSILINDYGVSYKKVTVIPHGIYVPAQKTNDKIEKASKLNLIIDNSPIILCFGEIRRDKGIDYLIRAMPRILRKNPFVKLIIAGYHDPNVSPESRGFLSHLINLVHDLKVERNVIFIPYFVPGDEINAYFTVADIVVFPYLTTDIVAASGPLSMAIAFSKPVVASSIMRFTEHLENQKNSILVPPANSTALAEAINMLIENPELRQGISKKIKDVKGYMPWDIVAEKTLALYKELMKE